MPSGGRVMSEEGFMGMSHLMDHLIHDGLVDGNRIDNIHFSPPADPTGGHGHSAPTHPNSDSDWTADAPMPPDSYVPSTMQHQQHANPMCHGGGMHTMEPVPPVQFSPAAQNSQHSNPASVMGPPSAMMSPDPSSMNPASVAMGPPSVMPMMHPMSVAPPPHHMQQDAFSVVSTSAAGLPPTTLSQRSNNSARIALTMTKSNYRDSTPEHRRLMHVYPEPKDRDPRSSPGDMDSEESGNWCQIWYHEFGHLVNNGQPFLGSPAAITVDGYCASGQKDRFCINSIGNGSREPGVVNVRGQIGKGVLLKYEGGVCTLINQSGSSVFVQSPVHADEKGDIHSTVYRLSPATCDTDEAARSMVIFNAAHFHKMIEEAKQKGYANVFHLHSFGITRMSFVKGFGTMYRRQTISETPVWIEIQFLHYMHHIDRVCQLLNPSRDPLISSFT